MFRLDNVSYHYPSGELALAGINLTIEEGQSLAVLGANGSGKSTLLKLMGGLLFSDQGKLHVLGQEINENAFALEKFARAFRRRVGFVFQNPEAQLFNSNVWDEIAYGPLHLGLSRQEVEQRCRDVIEMLNLEGLKNRPPFKLSGGEKKKVAIASVLAINPSVFLLDEPTSGLDPRTQRWLIDLIQQLHRAGKTIVTATHNLEILDRIAGQAVVIGEDHRIAAAGATSEILGDLDLLVRANLIDADFHSHLHGDGHRHFHVHG